MEPAGREVNPYAAPAAPVDLEPGRAAEGGGFRSLTPLAQAITGVMALLVLFAVLRGANEAAHISVLHRVLAEQSDTQVQRSVIDHRARVLLRAEAVVQLAAIVLFCFFMPRANRNARAFGAGFLRFSPRWSAGCFFVPIISFYQPYQAMKEIWLGSDPSVQTSAWRGRAPAVMVWWWVIYVGQEFYGFAAAFLWHARSKAIPDVIAQSWSRAATAVVSALSAVLAAAVVRAVARRQEERQRRLPAGAASQ